MWFYNTNTSADESGLFGQGQQHTTDRLLHYTIRQATLRMGFYNDDTQSSTNIVTNNWYHVAFVYDYASLKQSIYLNGKLDSSQTSKGPYKGMLGSIVIGKTDQYTNPPYCFSG